MKHNLLSPWLIDSLTKVPQDTRGAGASIDTKVRIWTSPNDQGTQTIFISLSLTFKLSCALLNDTNVRSSALSPQLHTVVSALDKLSYSGPVRSTYPQTFIELGQVFLNTQDCICGCLLSCFSSQCDCLFVGVWLCAVQDNSAGRLQHPDSAVIPSERHPRQGLRVCGRSESGDKVDKQQDSWLQSDKISVCCPLI